VGDEIQLQQVVVNLLLNAVHAIETGDVDERDIVIETKGSHEGIDLVVSDTGPGIPIGCEEKIFDSFFSTKDRGMGMGLAICRSITKTHGGSIKAESPPGGGARLTVSLPGGRTHT
jgi:signal transduction histidine kinase